ncbi:MAG: hypothetical protein WCR55_09905 [Lentisphaerota bacterium]
MADIDFIYSVQAVAGVLKRFVGKMGDIAVGFARSSISVRNFMEILAFGGTSFISSAVFSVTTKHDPPQLYAIPVL